MFLLRCCKIKSVFWRRLVLSIITPVILIIAAIIVSAISAYEEFVSNFKITVENYRRYW